MARDGGDDTCDSKAHQKLMLKRALQVSSTSGAFSRSSFCAAQVYSVQDEAHRSGLCQWLASAYAYSARYCIVYHLHSILVNSGGDSIGFDSRIGDLTDAVQSRSKRRLDRCSARCSSGGPSDDRGACGGFTAVVVVLVALAALQRWSTSSARRRWLGGDDSIFDF
eukprot:TRINITY_DN20028_c0_g1_i1.p2 TRINITY_DN20028_c0_g1~~TRINITY_DN20028_c0_g1_i1.p2  ORF type:complete len:166 (+),score=10.68 TRINITY_DN20028_c0_g1_i1:324-821(+)